MKIEYTVKSILSVLVVKIGEIICWNDGSYGSDDPDGCANNVNYLSVSRRQLNVKTMLINRSAVITVSISTETSLDSTDKAPASLQSVPDRQVRSKLK